MTPKKHKFEIAVYAVILCGGTLLAIVFDLFEYIHQYVATHESFELDETLIALPLLLVCLGIYAFRRSLELADRNRELIKSGTKLQAAYDEIRTLLESRQKFMSIACHELKGPLASVATALDLARMARTEEEAAEMMGYARSNLGNLQLLVGDVLLFTSLSHEGPLADKTPFVVRKDARVRGSD